MDRATKAWVFGLIGVLIFSGSLPATRAAVQGFSPLFVTSARAVVAALLGTTLLIAARQPRPARSDLGALAVVGLGVVVGFPLLTALALQHIDSAHSIVFIGLLPLVTAIFGVLRNGERPKPAYWIFAAIGSCVVAGFAFGRSGGGSLIGDALMVAAIVVCGLGYAEGARISRRLGGWQVISWALLLALPVMAAVALIERPAAITAAPMSAVVGLAYVSIFSMFVGFVFWYHGLATGGVARIGQLQLLQPFFGLTLAALLLHEPVAPTMVATAGLVVLCVVGARRFTGVPGEAGNRPAR